MKKLWIGWIVTLSLLVGAASLATASTLAFSPSAQTVPLGGQASVDLVISGLADSGGPSLGAFDLVVSFDPAILSPFSVTFGVSLGDGDLFEVDQGAVVSTGSVNLFAVSFLTPGELDLLQSDSFTLATFVFDTLAPGTSSLVVSDVLLGDAFGDPLALDASPAGSVAVPEPAQLLLVLFSLVGLSRRI